MSPVPREQLAMRKLPHEKLEYCPQCGVPQDFYGNANCTNHYEYDGIYKEIVAITCDECQTELHRYWFLSEFTSAMESAEREGLIAKDSYDLYWPTDSIQVDDERRLEWFFYLRTPICCDRPPSVCNCRYSVLFEEAAEYALESFDTLEDLYSVYHNDVAEKLNQPSCFTCINFMEPTCIPLRQRLYEIALGNYKGESPIVQCMNYEPDPTATGHVFNDRYSVYDEI